MSMCVLNNLKSHLQTAQCKSDTCRTKTSDYLKDFDRVFPYNRLSSNQRLAHIIDYLQINIRPNLLFDLNKRNHNNAS